ncbi:MAG: type II toxin-antitoxin system VapC family toxin [Geodermatophilaceae bacterium]|jgi:predicted nucleic acid-binding protein|nr:type II toxin-antitoxin system VapC family toxin [Geodermatophilaceae bacterium]
MNGPTSRYLVDTNVFLYARGPEHRYRAPCRRILTGVRDGEIQLLASVELIQEFVHVLLLRGLDRSLVMDEAGEARRQCTMQPFDGQVLTTALGLLRHYPGLGARDAVHTATAIAAGVPRVLSADRVFDDLDEVERVDPVSAAAELA